MVLVAVLADHLSGRYVFIFSLFLLIPFLFYFFFLKYSVKSFKIFKKLMFLSHPFSPQLTPWIKSSLHLPPRRSLYTHLSGSNSHCCHLRDWHLNELTLRADGNWHSQKPRTTENKLVVFNGHMGIFSNYFPCLSTEQRTKSQL